MTKKTGSHLILLALALFTATSLLAQQPEKKDQPAAQQKKQKQAPLPGAGTGGNTPHVTTSAVIDGNRVTVVYGRPGIKHPRTGVARTIWGGELVPTGQIWRTGSDEATLLITQRAIEIGGTTVPAGAYTLWTLLEKDGPAKLIINKQIGQWGINPADPKAVYDQANDVVRVELKKATLDAPAEQFTIAITRGASEGGVITLSWDTTAFSVPFAVKK